MSVEIDDRDPAVVYSAGWNQDAVAGDFEGTETFTTVAGSKATLTFRGTSVTVFGTIPAKDLLFSTPPMSSYSIDGGNPILFQPHLGPEQQFKQHFFKSPDLVDGVHTLEITNGIGDVPLILDVFVVQQSPADATATIPIPTSATSASTSSPSSVSSTTTSSSTSTSSSSSSIPTSTSTSTTTTRPPTKSVRPQDVTVTVNATSATDGISLASPQPTLAASNASSSSRNAGPIVGGVIGAIALLFLLGLVFTCWRKRKQNREADRLFNSSTIDLWRPPEIDTYPRNPSPTGQHNMVETSRDGTSTLAYDPRVQEPQFQGEYLPYGASSTTTNANNNGYNYGAVGAQPIYPQQQGLVQTTNNRTSTLADNLQTPVPQFPGGYAPYPQQQQGYPNQAYLPPSQLMNQSSGYGHGMPAPHSQNNANGSGATNLY